MTSFKEHALLSEHFDALRHTLIRMFSLIAIGMLLSFFFYSPIISFLTSPLTKMNTDPSSLWKEERVEHIHLKNNTEKTLNYQLPRNHLGVVNSSHNLKDLDGNIQLPSRAWIIYTKPIETAQLLVLGPLEGMTIALKTSLWVGALITSPLWLFILLQFINPALHGHERRLIMPFLFTSITLMFLGGLFAFKITIPLANQYLSSFNQAIGLNFWSLEHYLNYTFFLLLANSLAFELCAIGIFAVHLEIVSAEGLSKHRRIAIVLAFVIGAFLTPPDVLTQLMLAIPLMVLYEIVILYARLKTGKSNMERN